MGADEELLLKEIIIGDIKSSHLSDGYGIVQTGGALSILLQDFVIF